MKIISIDPGRETGYAYAEINDKKELHFFPTQGVDDVDKLWDRLWIFAPRIIIIEKWEDRQGARATRGVDSFPQQLIGVARLYSREADEQCGIYEQSASFGLGGFYTDAMLKKMGLLVRGDITNMPHGLSAMKHLLQWTHFAAGSQYITSNTDFAFRLDSWSEDWPDK
jgi:hypothetical protein